MINIMIGYNEVMTHNGDICERGDLAATSLFEPCGGWTSR